MKASPFRALWGWPIVIAVLSGAGLVGGLVGDGAWDWMTWVGLGVPCIASAWFGLRGRRARDA
jgi:hypothetical protein